MEKRYLLQSRSFVESGDVEEKHYSDQRLKEKWDGASDYAAALDKILNQTESEVLPDLACNAEYVSSYEDFKQNIIRDGKVKSKSQYLREGYSRLIIDLWFQQLAEEGIIHKVGNCTLYRLLDDNTEELCSSYESFKERIVQTGKLKRYRVYEKDGYGSRTLMDWFSRLEMDGVIRNIRGRYILSGEVREAMTHTYADFKNMVIKDGVLKKQLEYVANGYPYRLIKQWFKQLQAEGIIEKAVHRYQLKQPGDTNGYTPDKDGLSESLSLQVPG